MQQLKLWILFCAAFLAGCQVLEKKQQAGAAVELDGHYLYRSTLDSLTLGLSSEDSTQAAERYIRQWAEDILLYRNATAHTNEQIEALVSEYRRTLYAQAYEERLVAKRMPKTVADSAIVAIYEQMPNRFILSESILRGVLVVVHKDAPNVSKLRQWLVKLKLDDIEKYVYQNASGYELFTDKWLTTTEIIAQIPIERAELENKIRYNDRIEVADSTSTYILQITDKHMRGEAMPLDYARPLIEKIILNERQVSFLRQERNRLYNEAVKEGKVKFYEK